MTCPEHERTLRYVYGADAPLAGASPAVPRYASGEAEGDGAPDAEDNDEAHGLHVASCPECSEILAHAEEVLAEVGPVAAALRTTVPAPTATAHAPARAAGSRWGVGASFTALFLVAAGALFALGSGDTIDGRVAPSAAVGAERVAMIPEDPMEDALDDLDRALDRLSADLGDDALLEPDAPPGRLRNRATLPDL